VVLRGKRYDIEMGKRLTVAGKLRLLDQEAAPVGQAVVAAWRVIRLSR
jgi:hypothetical protein